MPGNGNNNFASIKHAMVVGLGAFFLAIGVGLGSQSLLKKITSLTLSFTLLVLIILIGIVFDIIGTASTAASEVPFHAKASRKLFGAKQSVTLVKNADKVANICNDVIGDVCASISGAIGATIVGTIAYNSEYSLVIAGAIMTGFISAATVGGKALGKRWALDKANDIIYFVGKIIAWLEKASGRKIIKSSVRKGRK